MTSKESFAALFRLSGVITGLFPHAGARFLDALISGALGNGFCIAAYRNEARRRLASLRKCDRILVVGDLNIGDAVTIQAAIAALRNYFPDADIDYAVNRFARLLVDGNPEITRVWPVFTGTYVPDENDFARLREVLDANPYDLIVNFCPVFKERFLSPEGKNVISYPGLAARLIAGERGAGVNHIVPQTYRFIDELCGEVHPRVLRRRFTGVGVWLSDRALEMALAFRESIGGRSRLPVVFYHPDASSRFTRVPVALQLALVRRLAGLSCTVMLGAGHTFKDSERELRAGLSPAEQENLFSVPASLPLDAFAALIDAADLYIGADTGPLHIAAARKYSRSTGGALRNRTGIFSLFGPTPARMYGYDSDREEFFPANQDAPAQVFASRSPCRNLTCINKMAKACRRERCFEGFDAETVAAEARAYLHQVRKDLAGRDRTVLPAARGGR